MKHYEPLPKLFGRRLSRLRRSRGLTQEQLGSQCGVGYKHVGEIERGETTPSFEVIEKLARGLDVEFYELFLPAGAQDRIEQELTAALERPRPRDPAAVDKLLKDLVAAVRRFVKDD